MNRLNFYTDMIELLKQVPDGKISRKKAYLGYMQYQLNMLIAKNTYNPVIKIYGPCTLSFRY